MEITRDGRPAVPPAHAGHGGPERSEGAFKAGDAYYVPPGHTPVLYAGTELVEFSPTEELQRTMEVASRNMDNGGA